MRDWKIVKLGDVFDLQMGKTPDRKNLDFFSTTDNKWISIADISKSDKYIFETKEYISDEAVKKSGIKQIPANTVIMSFKLSIGKTAITKEPMYSNEAIMAFLPNGKYDVDNDFLYHLFSNKDWTEGSNKAVKGITLNKASLLEAKILLPPLTIQKQIAKVMDKCTEIISKNERMLENYDSLIKSRFIEMFGDPVTNPMGWKIGKMNDITTKITDGEHGTVPRCDCNGNLYLMARNVSQNNTLDLSEVSFIPEENHNKIYKRCNPENGDLLLVCVGATVGKTCLVPEMKEFSMARSLALLKPDYTKINSLFLLNLVSSFFIQNQIQNCVHAAAQAGLYTNMIKDLKVYIPPLELQNDYAAFVQQIDKSKFAVQKSLEKAETLYKSLMQEYFV